MSSSKPTVRALVDGLSALAETLPSGMDTPFRLGICNGEDLQMVDSVDVMEWTRVDESGSPEELFVLIRAHCHPGEEHGELLRGVTADADDELRKLSEEP